MDGNDRRANGTVDKSRPLGNYLYLCAGPKSCVLSSRSPFRALGPCLVWPLALALALRVPSSSGRGLYQIAPSRSVPSAACALALSPYQVLQVGALSDRFSHRALGNGLGRSASIALPQERTLIGSRRLSQRVP